ncbi:MAG: ATP-binding protein [Pseudomonadota bacterium]
MRKLYLQIYLSFVAVFLLFLVLSSAVFFVLRNELIDRERLAGAAAMANTVLPAPDRPPAELRQKVQELARTFDARITVRGAGGELLANTGRPLPAPPPEVKSTELFRVPKVGPALALHLPDGRWVLVSHRAPNRADAWLIGIGLLALAIALGAYPVTRRITGRLERLQRQVVALGAGDLSARVPVEGSDEVAALAVSFNRSAGQVECLVSAHRALLAGVSHELRTPLARLRMALALMEQAPRPDLKQQVERNIAELDELIGELLLASRLDAIQQLERTEDVDLLALLAEEGARSGAEVAGDPVTLRGDPRLLRRLIRNLLENARRHAPGAAAEASVHAAPGGGAVLRVADRGPGVPEAERERVFEAFYRAAPADRADGGTGLGLALVRQIARRHGGDARCLARDGGGAVFEVELRGA